MKSQSEKMESKDFYNDLLQYVKDDVEQGIKDFEEGNVFTHEEVMKDIKEKYSFIK